VHKLEGGIAYLHDGTPWKLVEEIAGMPAPAPLAFAFVATLVQFICALFFIFGLFTRINAVLLAGALSGAILQNILAGRDPQFGDSLHTRRRSIRIYGRWKIFTGQEAFQPRGKLRRFDAHVQSKGLKLFRIHHVRVPNFPNKLGPRPCKCWA